MVKKKDKEKPMYSAFQNSWYILNCIWQNDKLLLLYMIIESVCGVLTPFFGIYLPKIVIEQLTLKVEPKKMVLNIGSFIILMAVVYFINSFVSTAKIWRFRFIRNNFMFKLYKKTLDCDYKNIEEFEGQTRYQKAYNSICWGDGAGVARIIPAITRLSVGILGFFLYSSVLGKLNLWIIVLLTMTALINYFTLRYATNYQHKNKGKWTVIDKKLGYISNKSADFTCGKDIRIYNMKDWFIKARNILLDKRTIWDKKIENRTLFTLIVDALIIFLRDGLAYVYLIYMVSSKTIEVADFVLFFGAIAGFSGWITQVINQVNEINSANLQICDTRDFLELSNEKDPYPAAKLPNLSKPLTIEFRNVTFAYEQGKENVLNNFNLKIDSGEKIALVGVNGAGKTTLVKLLCGFYTPDSGCILINGIDIRKFKKKELFQLYSTVFQDIVILPFTIAENVATCELENVNKNRVYKCLELAGLKEYVDKLPKGIYTKMLRIVDEDGILLSGGQQQKLIMARAIYKNAPIMILDEPTAALDPIAESEMYEKYNDLSQNKTAIFISHRLASTKFCDQIVFIKDGIVFETGSHEQLMSKDGDYAKMFEVQSHYYKESVEDGRAS